VKLSKAIEMLERCAKGNEDLADGFRRAIEIAKQISEIDEVKTGEKGVAALTINGRKVYVDDGMTLTYEAVAILALGGNYKSGVLYTITVRQGYVAFEMVPDGPGIEGRDGTVINVAYTGNA
jgi:hypothetical protein